MLARSPSSTSSFPPSWWVFEICHVWSFTAPTPARPLRSGDSVSSAAGVRDAAASHELSAPACPLLQRHIRRAAQQIGIERLCHPRKSLDRARRNDHAVVLERAARNARSHIVSVVNVGRQLQNVGHALIRLKGNRRSGRIRHDKMRLDSRPLQILEHPDAVNRAAGPGYSHDQSHLSSIAPR